MASVRPAAGVDLADPRSFTHGPPYDHFSLLRREAPVHQATSSDGRRFWVVARHAEVSQVLRSSRRFSAEHGMTLDTIGAGRDPAAGVMLELTDPPAHGRLRRVIQGFFTRDFARRIEPELVRTVRTIADRVADQRVVDVPAAISRPLGTAVTRLLIATPVDEIEWLSDRAVRAFEEGDLARRGLALRELFAYFGHEVARRRRSGGGHTDVVGALLAASRDAGLSSREVVANCVNVAVGAATVRHAVSSALLELLAAPGRWSTLRVASTPIEDLVDELLRLAPPALHVARVVVEETELAGCRLTPGAVVTVWPPSANRDEAVFPDADQLRLDRRPNEHLSFATGAHACIGATIARTTLRIALTSLFERFAMATADAGRVRYLPSTFVMSVTACPARFTPAPPP
jgi:cytochrome P450